MDKINLAWDKQCALRALRWSGEVLCVVGTKVRARRAVEEGPPGRVRPEPSKEQ